jgi:hypothetical protein
MPAASPQCAYLRDAWPRVWSVLCQTYATSPAWGSTDGAGHNDAGYLAWGLRAYQATVWALHGRERFSHDTLDYAAAREILYHARHNTPFRRPAAALAACLQNLPRERPARLIYAENRSHAPPRPTKAAITAAWALQRKQANA